MKSWLLASCLERGGAQLHVLGLGAADVTNLGLSGVHRGEAILKLALLVLLCEIF